MIHILLILSPAVTLTLLFRDWHSGLKGMGMLPLMKMFQNDWFWFIPVFSCLTVILGHYATQQHKKELLIAWELSMVLLIVIWTLHSYTLNREYDIVTLTTHTAGYHPIGSAFKNVIKFHVFSILSEVAPYPLSAVIFLAERRLLAAVFFLLIPVGCVSCALVLAIHARKEQEHDESEISDPIYHKV
jgi:hypothetical protein